MIFKKWNISAIAYLTLGCYLCLPNKICAIDPIPISGDISKIPFDTLHKIYCASADIQIPAGCSVQIPAGTIFLFENSAIFYIHGRCSINGTNSAPVIFTSKNDSVFNQASVSPSPFDWTGIRISESAEEVTFRNVIIKYAKSPFESQCPSLKLEFVRRSQTVEKTFLIKGNNVLVPANSNFVYITPTPKPPEITQPVLDTAPHPILPNQPKQETTSWWKQNWCRWVLLGTGTGAMLASGGCYGGYYSNMNRATEKSDRCREITTSEVRNFELYRKAYNEGTTCKQNGIYFKHASVASGIVGALFLAGYGVTFYF
jgi:hypothetical protein